MTTGCTPPSRPHTPDVADSQVMAPKPKPSRVSNPLEHAVSLREQARTLLEQAASEWVSERVERTGCTVGDAEAALAELAGIKGHTPAHAANNLRRSLAGQRYMSPDLADRVAAALGRRFELFLRDPLA